MTKEEFRWCSDIEHNFSEEDGALVSDSRCCRPATSWHVKKVNDHVGWDVLPRCAVHKFASRTWKTLNEEELEVFLIHEV